MRLNLGCGDDIRNGYVNVDFRPRPGVDRVVDLSIFPWPFDSDSADEILMLDFLEHFPYERTSSILMECYRVLRSSGKLVIQVPDAEILGAVMCRRGKFQCNRCGEWMDGIIESTENRPHEWCPKCLQPYGEVLEAAVRRMFGGQDFPGNFHHVCFTYTSLMEKAAACGLRFDRIEEEEHQAANWSIKCAFDKGDLWA